MTKNTHELLETPYFLVGAERSGSTLLRLMLDSHPNIAFTEEFEYSVEQIQDNAFPELNDFYDFLETNRPFQGSGFKINKDLTYPELIDSFLQKREKRKQAIAVGATIHFGFKKVLLIWPNAKFIHLIRDPRNVSPSVIKMGWAHDTYHGATKWIDAETEWDKLIPEIKSEQYITVRFEDLMKDYKSELKKICEFMGEEYTEKMMSYADETEYDIPSPIRAQNWRTSLGDRQIQLIETRTHELMQRRGYKLSGTKIIEVSKFDLQKLKALTRIKTFKSGFSKYGFFLYAQSFISRRLPFEK